MKITKMMHGYKVRMSDGEMDLLRKMVEIAEMDKRALWAVLPTQARRSYSRRCGPKGHGYELLRIDADWRGDA